MAAGIITSGSAPRLLLPGISEMFGMAYKAYSSVISKIYDMETSDRNYEEAVQMVGIGMATLKGEGEAIQAEAYKQGYVRITNHNVWAKRMRITMEAFQDNLYLKQAPVMAKELAKALFHAKEVNAAALLNNSTSTSAPYLGGDGKALLATDHPTGSGATYANKPSVDADLSELVLEQACIDIMNFVGADGLKIMARPVRLIVPNASIFDAHRILKSDKQADTANNTTNALKYKGLLQEVVNWSYLTDNDMWMVITDVPGAVCYQRAKQELSHYSDDNTFDEVYTIKERYSFDYTDPRHFYGSVGA